ncbi:hypothetical protein BKA57DRAFT_465132, partial [Linnemannia elongata]
MQFLTPWVIPSLVFVATLTRIILQRITPRPPIFFIYLFGVPVLPISPVIVIGCWEGQKEKGLDI